MSFKKFICKIEGKEPLSHKFKFSDKTQYRLMSVDLHELTQLWLQWQNDEEVSYDTLNDSFSWSSLGDSAFTITAMNLPEDTGWVAEPAIMQGLRKLFVAIWEGRCYHARGGEQITVYNLSPLLPDGAFIQPDGAVGLAARASETLDTVTEDELLGLMADDEEADSPFRVAPW